MSWATNRMEVPAWGWALAGAGVAVVAVVAARRQMQPGERRLRLRAALTIQAPAARVYELWRDPQTHAQLRRARVTPLGEDGTRWGWRREFGNGGHIEGEIRVTEQQPGERMEWITENLQIHFRPGAPMRHIKAAPRGWLRLRPRGEATEVCLQFDVEGAPALPWVRAGIAAGMKTALRRLRMLSETGALATTAGQPAGERSRKGRVLLRMIEGPQPQAAQKAS